MKIVKTKSKRRISLFLSVLLIFSSIPEGMLLAAADAAPTISFSGEGSGTINNPYRITSADQLNEMRNDLSAHYVLDEDIDMSTIEDWIPVGSDENNSFNGSFNGQGNKIKNLSIRSDKSDNIGLFGYCNNNVKIKNINLDNIFIQINHSESYSVWYCYIGAIAGRCNNISNCSVTGEIHIKGTCFDTICAGGIVGYGANILKCTNRANITIENLDEINVGGIAGSSYGKGIISSNNYGNVSAVEYEIDETEKERSAIAVICCGGICGKARSIKHCNNYGNIDGKTMFYYGRWSSAEGSCNVGGVFGARGSALYCSNYGNINSYALCGGSSFAGGINGCLSLDGYYDGEGIKYCYNMGEKISSICQKKDSEEQYVDIEDDAGRISGSGSPVGCYSLETTTVNDQIPTEYISDSERNGASLDESTMNESVLENSKDDSNIVEIIPQNGETIKGGENVEIKVTFDGEVARNRGNYYIMDLDHDKTITWNSIDYSTTIEGNTLIFDNVSLPDNTNIAVVLDERTITIDGKPFFGLITDNDWTFNTGRSEVIGESERNFIDNHLKFIESSTGASSEYDKMTNGFDVSDSALNNLKGMETAIAAWKLVRKDIFDNPYDIVVSEMIISQQSADSQIDSFKLNLYKTQRSIINNTMQLIEGKVSLSVSEKNKIEKLFTEMDFSDNETYNLCRKIFSQNISDSELQNYFHMYDTTNKFMSLMGDAENIVNSVIDVINYCSVLQAYLETSKEFKTVMMQIVDRCAYENPLLASSIMDYLTLSDGYDAAESIIKKISGNVISVGIDFYEDTISKKVINYLLENMAFEGVAEKVAENLLAFVKGMKIGAAIGVTVNNILFNTDKVADSYVETYACVKLAVSLRHVLDDNKTLFQKHRNLEYAKLFCETYRMYKNTQMNISDDMIDYICANYGGLFSKIFQQGEKEANLYRWQRKKVFWQTSYCHQEEPKVVKTDYNTKTFVVACPVDVVLYDKDSMSILNIKDDMITDKSDYVVADIRNGIKYITVPDGDYSIKILAKDNASMSYAVQSYDMLNLVGAATFTNIDLQKGHTYDGIIPEGSDVVSEQVALRENGIKVDSNVHSDLQEGYIEISNIELDKQEINLKVGELEKLDAAIFPNNATVNVVTWYSENPDIADIDEYGNIRTISEGQATIVCSSLDGLIKKTAVVNVSDLKWVKSILLTAGNQTVAAGKTLQLNAEILPENAENKVLKWSSDNVNIAIVDQNGMVTAVGIGQATITAESTDGSGSRASCVVTVTKTSTDDDKTDNDNKPEDDNKPSDDNKPGDDDKPVNDRPGSNTPGNPSGGNVPGGSPSGGNQNGNNGNNNNNGDNSEDEQLDSPIQIKLLYYIVEFNANAGTKLSRKTMTLLNNDNLGILPKVQREDYIFNGWYTQKSGGTKVNSSTVLNAGTTLFAQWAKVDKPSKIKIPSLKSKKAGQLAVSFKKITGVKRYEIAYSTNKKFSSSSTKNIVSASPKKTLKKLKSGKKYYVRVRAYKVDSTGKKVYGAYSKVKSMKVK